MQLKYLMPGCVSVKMSDPSHTIPTLHHFKTNHKHNSKTVYVREKPKKKKKINDGRRL
jgi:hypothetical protein